MSVILLAAALTFGAPEDQAQERESHSALQIRGQAVNYLGSGIQDLTVAAKLTLSDGIIKEITALTNDYGDFELDLPPPAKGEISLSFRADAYETQSLSLTIPESGDAPFVAIRMVGALVLRGRVFDALQDKPVRDATVTVNEAYREQSAQTDAQGRFEIGELLEGGVRVTVEAEGYGREVRQAMPFIAEAPAPRLIERPAERDAVGPKNGKSPETVEIGLKPERVVTLVLVDEKDRPVPRVTVEVYDMRQRDLRTVVSKEDGQAVVKGVHFDSATLALRVSHEAFVSDAEFDRQIELPADSPKSTHRLVLQAAATIAGNVTDAATHRGLGSARVMAGDRLDDNARKVWTGMDGGYEIHGIPSGRVVVTVHRSGRAPELKEVEASPGSRVSVDFELREARNISGVVRDAQGAGVSGAEVRARRWRDHETLGLGALTDQDGRFILADAPQDSFTIDVFKREYKPIQDQPVSAGAADIVFTLERGESWNPARVPRLGRGIQAPDLTLETLSGRTVVLSKLKGKVVLLDFWATWCPPCLAELPGMKKIAEQFGEREDFILIGISLDRDEQALKSFVQKQNIGWPQAFGKSAAAAAQAYGAELIPALFLIDRDGKVAAMDLLTDDLPAAIRQVIGKDERSAPEKDGGQPH